MSQNSMMKSVKCRPAADLFKSARAVILMCVVFAAVSLLPMAARAQSDEPEGGRTVRVGWYESSYNSTDRAGRKSGYAYEYQLKIAAYTGWKYEYVSGSWTELLQMLIDGEIDLMSDVSFTGERADKMLFSSLPMGTEEYYIYIAPTNDEISAEDISTLNGKRIGVNKDSIQEGFYTTWAKQHRISAELVEVTCSEDESLQMMEDGELDAYVTVDSFKEPERAVPVCKVGSSDFYFAVRKDGHDLVNELNYAMSRIQSENRFYNQQMFEKFMTGVGANGLLTAGEQDYLASHGKVRVGYQDNYLAFCALDDETKELTGALKDYLDYASDCIPNTHINFETTAYPTAEAALKALKDGEVDCVFPANLSGYDGEVMNLNMTSPLMRTDVYAVVRKEDESIFANKEHVVVAVNEGNPNYETFLMDNFPKWVKVYYPETSDCLQAVAQHVADCVLISSYRFNNIARQCEKLNLTTLTTGVGMDYCFAVRDTDTQLYSIMTRTADLVPNSFISAALSYYITEDAKLTFKDFLLDNLVVVLCVFGIVLAVILALLIRSKRAEKKAAKLILATESDELTGLYNRSYFFEYAERIYRDHADKPMDAIVLDIDQFHSVNALNGRDFGDQVLKSLGSEIRKITQEAGGIAGRFEADRFDIFYPHTEDWQDYQAIFDRLQGRLDRLMLNASIQLRMGVMPWQKGLEPVQLFDRAATACSMARGNYKGHMIVFDETVRRREIYEQRLLNDLRRALDSYEMEVHYQPKFDIQSKPPRMVSAEALVRWRHPELGMIAPGDFIPLFEQSGRIIEVDQYVWTEAAKQIARWRELYGVTIPISVNLSRIDVFDPALEERLSGILSYYELEPSVLKLEVTETAYTENADQVIRVVEGLRGKGFVVEMDDFGTGYSSLNMLSAMPVDVLKMDRAFVRNIEQDERNLQMVGLILGIARNLQVPVIAEGVETEKQLQLLRDLGCEIVQGYYFSRPVPPAEFEKQFISSVVWPPTLTGGEENKS